MIRISQRGNFKRTEKFLNNMRNQTMFDNLEMFAREGVDALSSATPIDTALTSVSWGYRITVNRKVAEIAWLNENENAGLSIVILLQYGHGTGTGGYVEGYDFINPALRPIFNRIQEDVWRAVTNS